MRRGRISALWLPLELGHVEALSACPGAGWDGQASVLQVYNNHPYMLFARCKWLSNGERLVFRHRSSPNAKSNLPVEKVDKDMNSKFKLNNFPVRAGSGGLTLALFAATLVAVVAVGMTVTPREIAAKPAYAAATGRPCTACHTAPPKLNACGKKYQKDHNTKC